MKSLIQTIVVAAALVAPVMSFAQSNAPVTRAEVRARLVQLEKAGYDPSSVPTNYPVGLQAAEAKVAAQNGAAGVGGVAGHAAISKFDWNEMYGHH
jgi:uncharacterized membrane protein